MAGFSESVFISERFSQMLFIFFFILVVMISHCTFVFPFISVLPLLLITSSLCLYPSLFSFLSQAPCENLRAPSTYPGNILPHHPGQANFEDFTCWADPGGGSIKVRVMQPKPTIQQELSNTRTVRNQVQWRHFFHRDRGRQTNQIWQMWWNNFNLQQVERKSHV